MAFRFGVLALGLRLANELNGPRRGDVRDVIARAGMPGNQHVSLNHHLLGHRLHVAVDRLLEVGFDERYGARPLQRAIEEWVVQPLAQWLVGRKSLSGNTLELDIQDNKLHIEPR